MRKNYRRIERRYGSFQRKFSLPREVEADDIKAEFSDGILTLSIPKSEAAKPTEIPVTNYILICYYNNGRSARLRFCKNKKAGA